MIKNFLLLSLLITLMTAIPIQAFTELSEVNDNLVIATVTIQPTLTIENGCYGSSTNKTTCAGGNVPNSNNKFDFWSPESLGIPRPPTGYPLIIFIHGGGLTGGNKEKLMAEQRNVWLNMGIAVMSINYRLTPDVKFPKHYYDCVRAIQYARYNSGLRVDNAGSEYNLQVNPNKIALVGTSAGGLAALWIAFHNDFARDSNNPVWEMSSRVQAVLVTSAQTTVDYNIINDDFPESLRGEILAFSPYFLPGDGNVFGLNGQLNTDTNLARLREASPWSQIRDQIPPPVFMGYRENNAIHDIAFGRWLKAKMYTTFPRIPVILRHENDIDSSAQKKCFLEKYVKGTRSPEEECPSSNN